MHCVKDVKVNDVITFDHSAEIEVRIVLDYCIYLLFVAFVFESISGQENAVHVGPIIARRSSADRRTLEDL